MSSIKEIVLKTGLSQSTVMRVLKGSTNVKPETMEKIFNAAKEIGYEINRTKSTIGAIFITTALLTALNHQQRKSLALITM